MNKPASPAEDDDSASLRVRGQVQGVGFRPFVWQKATGLGLRGSVRNDAEGVLIEVWGPPSALSALTHALHHELPPLARVTAVDRMPLEGLPPEGFSIVGTAGGVARTRVAPDAATCPACRLEIGDPAARRHGYAFTNCTHCGPRFSIVTGIPYDRAATTMSGFPLCADCAAEYADPADRRFHAQPIACPVCGPRLWLEAGGEADHRQPVQTAAALLRAGRIVAVKGLGGFHLACDATSAGALTTLRERKRRPSKPFALMARDIAQLRRHASVDDAAAALLQDPASPVVLLPAAPGTLPDAVAPGQVRHGWMLPYTPLHHLLLQAVGRPLVMTSGNLSGEPQVTDNDEARGKLGGIADALLLHDRPIARRLDDSVAVIAAGAPRLIRRARGYAPVPLALPQGFENTPAVTAWGGQLKGAICVAARGEALLSHHLGDLDEPLSWAAALRAERDYTALFDHDPARVACDSHPDYRTTAAAEAQAAAAGLPLIRVQHHHAHVAATMAENGWPRDGGPVLGVAMDGLGWGPEGTVWGGEFLLCTYQSYRRVGHLRPVPLPGGEAAQREPWRNLWAQLVTANIDPAPYLPGKPLASMAAMVTKGLNAPLTSSAGRLFDAAAAAAGLAPERLTFEGEAAMALEAAAERHAKVPPYPFGWNGTVLDTTAMWHALIRDKTDSADAAFVAARFHRGFAEAVCTAAIELAHRHGALAIVLGGGVFQNALLLGTCLDASPAPLLMPTNVPAGDGGLALGQAVVAAAQDK